MSVIDVPSRRFISEFSSMVGKTVVVRTVKGENYTGRLVGYDSSTYSVVLADAKDEGGQDYHRLFLYNHVISRIFLAEEPMNLEKLAERLEGRFPKMVKYYPEARVITVMKRITVSEKGVEGTGPMAERVKGVFDEFIAEMKEAVEREIG